MLVQEILQYKNVTADITVPAGVTIYGNFLSIELSAGKGIAYYKDMTTAKASSKMNILGLGLGIHKISIGTASNVLTPAEIAGGADIWFDATKRENVTKMLVELLVKILEIKVANLILV